MKKIISLIISGILLSLFVFSESYKIEDSKFNITGSKGMSLGKTNDQMLLMKFPIDTKTTFTSKDELELYIHNYKQDLINTRLFKIIDITSTEDYDKENNTYKIHLQINLTDSSHFLAMPYPKYSSNDGITIKLKVKDNNFLGSLNPLSTDFSVNYNDTINKWNFGINFAYDYPFKAGIFNASWANLVNVNYTIGDLTPNFYSKIGVGYSLPKDKFSIDFGTYQIVGYSKDFYFSELLQFSTPINIHKLSNFSTVKYTPHIDFSFNWDIDLIKNKKQVIDSFELKFGHAITNSKIDYENFFRKGYSISLNNDFVYDFKNNEIAPSISLEAMYYNNFDLFKGGFLNRFGVNCRLYIYSLIDVYSRKTVKLQPLGTKLRGVLDNQLQTPFAFIFNLDLPFSLFTTHFKHESLNFNLQMAPFIDVALSYDPVTGSVFSIKQGKYCAGLELLVNPIKYSSYTLRASVGVDLLAAFRSPRGKLKGLWDNKEIYIGLDLHY